LKVIRREAHPLARSILIHRLFGNDQRAPFKVVDGFSLLTSETESADPNLARYCANLLLDRWPWTNATWRPTNKVNRSVKLFLKSLGLRANAPNRQGVLETFFINKMRISVKLRWKKALAGDWRDAERRCLRVQQFDTGDPTSWVLMTDTFNEVLLQGFSTNHPGTAAAYGRATPRGKHHPDLGNWVNNPSVAAVLPKAVPWFKTVHAARVKADLAHAKSKGGVRTRPVGFRQREKLRRGAQAAWAELIIEWKKII
jgi:hypothetical protein